MLHKIQVRLNLVQEVKVSIRCLRVSSIIEVLVYSDDSF